MSLFSGPLKDICLEYKIPDPIFTLISDVGPPHSREFTYECTVASIKTVATGNTKKMAKQLAAKQMLERYEVKQVYLICIIPSNFFSVLFYARYKSYLICRIKDVLPDIAQQYSRDEDQKAISDVDMRVLKLYNDFFGNIIPDKSVDVGDYSKTLKKLMLANNLTYENFAMVSEKDCGICSF